MTAAHLTNYRLDWERFCSAQPAEIAAELNAVLSSTQGNNDVADAQLARAIGRAATDPSMARMVLQRVLPGLIAVAKRRMRVEYAGFSEILHELVANTWIAIRVFPLDRRPTKIAANLVRDAEYLTFSQPRRLRRLAIDDSADVSRTASPTERNAGEELITALAAARQAGANPDGLRLLGELAVAGRSVQDLAVAYGVSTRTILNRRLAAERDLAAHAA